MEMETRRLNEGFDVDLSQLVGLVEHYRNRKFNEDIAGKPY